MSATTSLSTVLASCMAALLWTGDAAANDRAPGADDNAARSIACHHVTESVFVLTPIGEDQVLSYQRVLIDAPIGEVWPVLRDIERFAEAVLPDLAPTFMWLDGGGPETIPSRFQFSSGADTLVEEIIYRSEAEKQILVRLVEPVLGMQEYYAFGDLTRACGDRTVLEYTRYLELAPGTDIEFFRALFTQEFIAIPAYFAE
ncbi:hypothetical protein WMF18_06845 [Sorangium sp. So ce315]|uniref:hypothetical protein n=1 Tax=Sorangium sp. So ce315 TaxID=3133299 RepID=UPI003F63A10C